MIASGSRDSTVKLWRSSDGKLLRTLDLDSNVYAVAFSHDDQLLATGGDGPIRFWTMSDGTERGVGLSYDGDGTRSLVFSPDGRRLAWANIYHGVKIRQVLAGAGAEALQPSSWQADEGSYSVVFSPDGQLIAASDPAGQIKIWRVAER